MGLECCWEADCQDCPNLMVISMDFADCWVGDLAGRSMEELADRLEEELAECLEVDPAAHLEADLVGSLEKDFVGCLSRTLAARREPAC
jgi:hypothetical protein